MSQPILIAGAGITGLTLALSLTQNGVPVRIVDKESKPIIFQRGMGIHPRTLEMHSLLGTVTEVMEKSTDVPPLDFYSIGGKELLQTKEMSKKQDPTPDRPYLSIRRLWQSRHLDILRDQLLARGVEVEYGTTLDSFSQNADEVTVSLVKEGGSIETLKVPYLVSTEGAHSVVRKGLGLSFLGETRAEHMCLAEVEVIEGENLAKDKWAMYGDFKTQLVSFSPCEAPDLPYYGIMMFGQNSNTDELIASKDAFIKNFYEITGRTDVKFGKFLGIRKYTPNVRMVDRFQEGRCFVAGDAAHVHSPAGGQGLNSGFQDAMNLGWKLSLVYKNLAPSSLLDSYTAERLPVIAYMLNKTNEVLAKTMKFDASDPRNKGWERGGELNMLGINYRGSSILVDELHNSDTGDISNNYTSGIEVKAGDRAPDAPALEDVDGKVTSIFALLNAYEHTILVFAHSVDDALPFADTTKPFADGIAKSVVILPSGSSASAVKHGKVLVDKNGHAFAAYVEKDVNRKVSVVVVRPDGYVGAMVQSVEGLKEYFSKVLV